MTIYLDCLLPNSSSDYGERDGQPLNAPISILLRVGFTGTRRVTVPPVGSYPTFPSLPRGRGAVYFCCTFLKVAFTGRYPAPLSCGARTFLTAIFHAARSLGLLDNILLFLPCLSRTVIGVFTVFLPHGDRELSIAVTAICLAVAGPPACVIAFPRLSRRGRPDPAGSLRSHRARTFLTAIFHAARSLGLLDNILLFLPCFFRTAIGVFTVFIPHGDRSFHRVFSARRSGAFRCRYRDMPRGGGLSHTFLLQRRRPQFSHSMTLSSV